MAAPPANSLCGWQKKRTIRRKVSEIGNPDELRFHRFSRRPKQSRLTRGCAGATLMKKNTGIIAILAAVMALFGISNLSKNSSSGPIAAEPEKGAKTVGTGTIKSGEVNDSCREILKRLQLFIRPDQLKNWNYLHSCYPNNPTGDDQEKINPLSSFPDVDFVIATVPNPVATHLPLLFDRMLEIIEQAAQDNNYLYNSSWLPWDEAKDYSGLADQVAGQEALDIQENQPGLLVFSKPFTNPASAGGLAVFVVSELPTGGINREQFENALKWIYQLGDFSSKKQQINELKILGPTFSGSLSSLYSLITSITSPPPPSMPLLRKLSFKISSGTVSSDSDGEWFKQQLEQLQQLQQLPDPSTFETAMGGDCVLVNRFLNYVQSQNYDPDRVAVLSEDETAFGGSFSGNKQAFGGPFSGNKQDGNLCGNGTRQTYLYYPRDIATLRSAYEQQAIFSSGKQAPNTNTSVTTLRGDLSEPANSNHDTVRSYGGQLTPLAQESILLSIVDVMKERKIQFVVLRSTNSLDQIFLTQFLRRLLPDARIVIDGTDLLFTRGSEGTSLRGVMALSTYPLLTWQQDWTFEMPRGKGGPYRIFGEDAAEGLYIAARGLFLDQGSGASIESLATYAPPAWAQSLSNDDEDKRPATWLTVIGHRQFWPVAVLTSHTILGKTKAFPVYRAPDIVRLLPVDFWILLFLCLAWSILHLVWCSRASISPEPALFRLTYFAPVPHWQHPALIGFGSMIVAAVAFILAVPLNLLNWEPGLWYVVVALVILAVFISVCGMHDELPLGTDGRRCLHERGLNPVPLGRRYSVAAFARLIAAARLGNCSWVEYLQSHPCFLARRSSVQRGLALAATVTSNRRHVLLVLVLPAWAGAFWQRPSPASQRGGPAAAILQSHKGRGADRKARAPDWGTIFCGAWGQFSSLF